MSDGTEQLSPEVLAWCQRLMNDRQRYAVVFLLFQRLLKRGPEGVAGPAVVTLDAERGLLGLVVPQEDEDGPDSIISFYQTNKRDYRFLTVHEGVGDSLDFDDLSRAQAVHDEARDRGDDLTYIYPG